MCAAACASEADILRRALADLFVVEAQAPPLPESESNRRRIIDALPAEGRVQLAGTSENKVAALLPILRAYGRESQIEVRVVKLPYAAVALHARAVLLIAEHTITQLPIDELQALAAHELAHEYLWDEYWEAKAQQDAAALKRIDLVADGIAIATLSRIGLNPRNLLAGIGRLQRFNEKLGLSALNTVEYPSPRERRRFHETVLRSRLVSVSAPDLRTGRSADGLVSDFR